MKPLRGEELWAAKMIEMEVKASVQQHDDGSHPGMYDLDIMLPGGATAAVEVTAAADQDAVEQWNLMNGGGRWTVEGLRGGWMVGVRIGSSWKRLKIDLPGLLGELEALGIPRLDIENRTATGLEPLAVELGIENAHQSGTGFPGSIYMTFDMPSERIGGMVPAKGDGLAAWLSDFLREARQADVLRKLASSDRDERHAFILLPGFNTAPFVVNDLLVRTKPPLPTLRPELPAEVTHVWAVSTWTAGVGIRWSPDLGWMTFDKGLDENGTVGI